MFICVDTNGCCGLGKTLEIAYQEYKDCHDNDTFENLDFYEAEEIKVELKLQKKEVIVKKETR